MNSLRTFISPVFCMSLLAGPMLQAGTLAAGMPDEPAANAEASLPPGVTAKMTEPDKLVVDFRLARQALEEGTAAFIATLPRKHWTVCSTTLRNP